MNTTHGLATSWCGYLPWQVWFSPLTSIACAQRSWGQVKGLLLIKPGSLSTEASFAKGAKTIKLQQIYCSCLTARFLKWFSRFLKWLRDVNSIAMPCLATFPANYIYNFYFLLILLFLYAAVPCSTFTGSRANFWTNTVPQYMVSLSNKLACSAFDPTTCTHHATNSFTHNLWALKSSFSEENVSFMAWCYVWGRASNTPAVKLINFILM